MPQYPQRDGAFTNIAAVTPNDTTAMGQCRGLYVGATGNLSVLMPGNPTPVVFTAVPAGTYIPIAPTHVRATGTTATAIMRMW